MISSSAKEVFILGLTLDGKTFRPSDWAERLAGVMSSFRPGGATPGSHQTGSMATLVTRASPLGPRTCPSGSSRPARIAAVSSGMLI